MEEAKAPGSEGSGDSSGSASSQEEKPKVDRERILYLWSRVRNISRILGRLNKMSKDIQIFGAARKEYNSSLQNRLSADKDVQKVSMLIMTPDSPLRKYWALLMIFMLLYTAIVTPYRICFLDDVVGTWLIVDICTDCIFVIDIVLTFFSAYEEEDGTLVVDWKVIGKKYVKSWLVLDMLGCLPISYISFPGTDSETSSGDNYNRLIRLLRVPRMYRLLRVFRLMKLTRTFKANSLVRKLINTLKMNNGIVRLLRFAVTIMILVHVTGCFWFFLAKLDDFGPDTWVTRYGYSNKPNIELYILAVYYVFTTLTTVGYGDITARTLNEQVFAIVLMGFGVGFYSYTISNLSTIMENIDIRSANLKTRLSTLHEFAQDSNIPKELKGKIKRNILHNHEQNVYSWFSHDSLLKELPASLRTEISLHMHKKIVEEVVFFQDKDPGFISYIVPALKHITFRNLEFMFSEGDYADEVYFLVTGRVNLKAANGIAFKTYVQGSYFGEVEILENTVRTYTVQVASPIAELLAMSKAVFWSMMEEFPQVAQEVIETARLRTLKNNEAKQHALSLIHDPELDKLPEQITTKQPTTNVFLETIKATNSYVRNPRRRISIADALSDAIGQKTTNAKAIKILQGDIEDPEKEAHWAKLREKYSKPKQFAISTKEEAKSPGKEDRPQGGIITPQNRKGPLTFSSQILHLSKPPKFSDPATEDVSFESSLQSPLHVKSPSPQITRKLLTPSSEKFATGLSPDLDHIINALKGKEAFLDSQFANTDRMLETIEGRQEDLTEKLVRLAAVLRTPVDV
jgi:CRP-like cAMP-binding protein